MIFIDIEDKFNGFVRTRCFIVFFVENYHLKQKNMFLFGFTSRESLESFVLSKSCYAVNQVKICWDIYDRQKSVYNVLWRSPWIRSKVQKTDVTIHFGGLNASVLFPQHSNNKSNFSGPKTHVPIHVLWIHFHLSIGTYRIYKSTGIKPELPM